MLSIAAAPAQTEINPDQYYSSSSPDSRQAAARTPQGQTSKAKMLESKVNEQQNVLRDYHAQIEHQAQVAENAREIAAGSGGMEDRVSSFFNDYERERKQLENLKNELGPQISRVEQALAALQSEKSFLSAHSQPNGQIAQAANRRPAAAQKKPVSAPRAPMQASR